MIFITDCIVDRTLTQHVNKVSNFFLSSRLSANLDAVFF